MVLLLSGCASQQQDYVSAYLKAQALNQGAMVSDATLRHFMSCYEDFAGQVKQHDIGKLYASQLYFSDTLRVLYSRKAVIQAFRDNISRLDHIQVRFLGYSRSGRDVFVRWQMVTRMHLWFKDREATTIGISQLRFNQQGQVIFQQDFWDSGHGIYDQLPLIGSITRTIRSGL